MAMTETELLDLKKRVEEAKSKVAGLKGQQTALLKQLKSEFGVSCIEDAETKLDELTKNIETLQKKIRRGTEDLEKKFNLNEKE